MKPRQSDDDSDNPLKLKQAVVRLDDVMLSKKSVKQRNKKVQPISGQDSNQPISGQDSNQPTSGQNSNQPISGQERDEPMEIEDETDEVDDERKAINEAETSEEEGDVVQRRHPGYKERQKQIVECPECHMKIRFKSLLKHKRRSV